MNMNKNKNKTLEPILSSTSALTRIQFLIILRVVTSVSMLRRRLHVTTKFQKYPIRAKELCHASTSHKEKSGFRDLCTMDLITSLQRYLTSELMPATVYH